MDDPLAQPEHEKAFEAAAVQKFIVHILFSHSRLHSVVRLKSFSSSLDVFSSENRIFITECVER
jgi:hypothetical protein